MIETARFCIERTEFAGDPQTPSGRTFHYGADRPATAQTGAETKQSTTEPEWPPSPRDRSTN